MPEFDDAAGEEHAYSEQELRRVSFGNTERQMEILSELPKLISASQTDEELGILLSELLLAAIPRAEAVAVAHYDVNELPAAGAAIDPFPKPQALMPFVSERVARGTTHRLPGGRLSKVLCQADQCGNSSRRDAAWPFSGGEANFQ
jgi:hypothetical protein